MICSCDDLSRKKKKGDESKCNENKTNVNSCCHEYVCINVLQNGLLLLEKVFGQRYFLQIDLCLQMRRLTKQDYL